jgi:hypothetical protein
LARLTPEVTAVETKARCPKEARHLLRELRALEGMIKEYRLGVREIWLQDMKPRDEEKFGVLSQSKAVRDRNLEE